MDFQKELFQMRNNFKTNKDNIKIPSRPTWMKSDDLLNCIYNNKEYTLAHGEVYYAHIVQANNVLFESVFPLDLLPDCNNPANIVFSESEYFEENPMVLGDIAHELFLYKYSEKPVPEEYIEIVDYIRDEYDRSMVQFQPLDMDGIYINFIATLIYRPFLPKRYLRSSLLPIIASNEHPDSAIILPKKFWSPEFTQAWTDKRL